MTRLSSSSAARLASAAASSSSQMAAAGVRRVEFGDPRVVVTPHVAWLSPGSVRRLRTSAARCLHGVLVAEEAAPTSAGGTP